MDLTAQATRRGCAEGATQTAPSTRQAAPAEQAGSIRRACTLLTCPAAVGPRAGSPRGACGITMLLSAGAVVSDGWRTAVAVASGLSAGRAPAAERKSASGEMATSKATIDASRTYAATPAMRRRRPAPGWRGVCLAGV